MTNSGSTASALSLVFADENSLTRDCFALSLSTLDAGITVHPVPSVGEARRLAESEARVDVVLWNLGSEADLAANLADALEEAVAAFHPAPVIVISDHDNIEMILEGLRLGIRGYIVASLGLGVAVEAIRLVVAGGTFVPATSLHKLGAPSPARPALSPAGTPHESIGGLTPREMAVLNCLREGKSNKIIAYQLGMCENTAKAHVRNVLKKLGATNRTEAAYLAHTRMSGAGGAAKVANGR